MRVVIAGAGSVGRSIARELLAHEHEVTLVDRQPSAMRVAQVAEADWLLADACELPTLRAVRADECDVVVAATGDDKANLVISLLAKTEFGVPRTVGRVNHPGNEWMFDEVWGVDVAVSTPRIMSALVEEAVSTGELVKLFTFNRSATSLSEIRLPAGSPFVGRRVRDLELPPDVALVALIRDGVPLVPEADGALEGEDEMLFLVAQESQAELATMFEGPAPADEANGS